MRYLVNGVEAIPSEDESVALERVADRWIVRSDGRSNTALTARSGDTVWVSYQGRVYRVEPQSASRRKKHATNIGDACAPMPGQIVETYVVEGDLVKAGQKLLVLEAMKMQQPILAPYDGVVTRVPVARGDQVVAGQLLVHIDENDE